MIAKKKTSVLLCMILALALLLSACSSGASGGTSSKDVSANPSGAASEAAESSKNAAPVSSGRSLAEHGMDLVDLVRDMVSDDVYVSIYMGGSQAITDEIAKLAEGDYTTAPTIYQITVPNLPAFLDATITSSGAAGTFSETLKEYMLGRMILTVSSMVNNAYGSAAIAAASVCTASKTFATAELTENMIYVYLFENAHPVLITFFQGEDSTASATAIPLFVDLTAPASADEVKALFANRGFEIVVEQVDYKP